MVIADPIVRKINDNIEALNEFEKEMITGDNEKVQDIMMNYPIVYIHNWKEGKDYEVYIGESNDIIKRTKEHYERIGDKGAWQNKLSENDAKLYIIGHEHFNKSLTLDIENRLILYLTTVEKIKKVNNKRGNPQKHYYPVEELELIFNKIWKKLRRDNKELFPTESSIKDNAIFKASPLHKLTIEQEEAKAKIIEKVKHALENDEKGQLIFVEGEAGSGKTVLNSSTFYEMFCDYEEKSENEDIDTPSCYLLVNHDEQITVYEQIMSKLGIIDKYGEVVLKPTRFINQHEKDLVDVVFIDEAHLLLTQGKQSYRGNNQLKDILDRARVVVVMFDENQILTTEQYWEDEILKEYRDSSIKNNNYIKLNNQLRMHANDEVVNWIDDFTKNGILNKLPEDMGEYQIKTFDTPIELDKVIRKRALKEDTRLSRIIASYDWKYNANAKPENDEYWEVKIGEWHKPWNRELEKELNREDKRRIKKLSWAEQPQTLNEVGSTFTIQGFDLNYAGVILGPSVKYRDGKIVFDPTESCNEKAVRNRTLSDGSKKQFGEELIKHEVRVLMTRGVNGLYIYACDKTLREKLKECCKQEISYSDKNINNILKVAEDNEEYKYE